METTMTDHGPTTSQLRQDIDQGRAGSKVNNPDPAAAPLGTDDEAAGVPPSAVAVEAARRQEVENARVQPRQPKLGSGAQLYAGLVAVIVAVLSAVALWYAS